MQRLELLLSSLSSWYSKDVIATVATSILAVPVFLDVSYYVLAITFVRMWQEQQPTDMEITRTICIDYGLYWLLLVVVYRILSILPLSHAMIHSEDDTSIAFVRTILSGCCFIIVLTLSYYNIRRTRQMIVEGGIEPPILLSSHHLKFLDTKQPLEPVEWNSPPTQPMIIVITGANTGIGKETVQQLYTILSNTKPINDHPKAIILLLCRSVQKGQDAIQDIIAQEATYPSLLDRNQCQLRVIPCDLCSFHSIRQAVDEIFRVAVSVVTRDPHTTTTTTTTTTGASTTTQRTAAPIIHTLINNAGVMLSNLSYTVDQHETCLQANFLGHFLLSSLLLPYISTSILNVTSSTYHLANVSSLLDHHHWSDNLQCRSTNRNYSLFGQYAMTKWFNILHTVYIAKKYPHLSTAAIHPGLVRTDVVRNMPWYLRVPNTMFASILQTVQKTPTQGAWNTIHVLALASQWYSTSRPPIVPSVATESTVLLTSQPPHEWKNGQYWVNRRPQTLVMGHSRHCDGNDTKIEQQAVQIWEWAIQQVQLTNMEIQQLKKLQQPTNNSSDHTVTTNNHSKTE
jgi:NAD(P)-dependent dehydrogenase (short-subunit alcohol dehydrogenase family)